MRSWWAGGFILAAAAVVWLYLPRRDKVGMAAQAIVALVIMVVLIKVAAAIYTDPRPFVADTSIKPLFAHPADNGFPSDRTALAATVALVVMMYRRWVRPHLPSLLSRSGFRGPGGGGR